VHREALFASRHLDPGAGGHPWRLPVQEAVSRTLAASENVPTASMRVSPDSATLCGRRWKTPARPQDKPAITAGGSSAEQGRTPIAAINGRYLRRLSLN